MKNVAAFLAGFGTAMIFATSAATLTIVSTGADDLRLVPAFTNLLAPGCPAACRNATSADIKAWTILQLQTVVANFEHQQAENAIPASTTLQAN